MIEKIDEIDGAFLVKRKLFKDKRGSFVEVFSNLNISFLQTNISFSKQGVFRGLHYQTRNPQGKMITVISGEITDVCLDLRRNSKTYGNTFMLSMSFMDDYSFFLPAGTAHGFFSKTDSVILYSCTTNYEPSYDSGVNIYSKELDIAGHFLISSMSEKDKKLPDFVRGRTFIDLKELN